MLLTKKKTAIIGGGPGGLTLARLLQRQGAAVVVYERDAARTARQQGATLDLHDESGLRALREAGLLAEFRANYRPGADRVRLLDAQATMLADQHQQPADHEFGHEHFRPEIDRGPLRNLLLDSLAPGTIRWDSQLLGLDPADAGGWTLRLADGHRAHADLVIGADGAHSRVRPLVTPLLPFYTGYTVVEGNVDDAAHRAPTLWGLLKGGKIFALDGEKSIILSAKGDGSLSFYTCERAPENWVRASGIDFGQPAQVAAWFARAFATWAPVWHELVAAAPAYVVPRPQYCMPLDQNWPAQSTITLLGDAAHLMPPYAGEGVNMAMLDALELSQALTNGRFADPRTAIASYETAMRQRGAEVAANSIESMEQFHSPGGAAWLRQVVG